MNETETWTPEADGDGRLYPEHIQKWLRAWRDPRPAVRALHKHTETLEAAQEEFCDLIKRLAAGYHGITINVGPLDHMNDVVPLLRWLAARGYKQSRDPDNYGNFSRSWYLGELTIEARFPTEGEDTSDDVCRFVECGVYNGKKYKLVCPGETLDEAVNKRIDDE